ncbi:MAG: UDP-N-acetylglucosamine 2-epimerase (non-hydrolyzing) [Rhodothermales bacterium]
MKIINVVGARPNFMKVAPLHREMLSRGIESMVVHTGQHYDEKMSDIFFRQLEMPEPDIYLGVGSASHAVQTARIMEGFEEVVMDVEPDLVLVVGDVNSTMACALVSTKLHVPVAHVEAGLRSGDRGMPEEINRIVTDSISDHLFVTEQSGIDNLKAEGVADEKVHMVGNVMIDSLVHFREKAAEADVLERFGIKEGGYALVTMHRPGNVDHEEGLRELLSVLRCVAAQLPVVFPMHPRTRNRFGEMGLDAELEAIGNVRLLEPLGYLEFLRLMDNAAIVVTDSGGIQEETTYLQVPCLTLRDNTERPITVTMGTNELLPYDADVIVRRVRERLAGAGSKGEVPPLWDGRASERIVDVLTR